MSVGNSCTWWTSRGLFGRCGTGTLGCRFSARLKTTLVRIVPGGEAGVTLECCGEVVDGEALRESCRRGVGDSEGVARVLLLLQVYGLTGYHPGLNQRLDFSRISWRWEPGHLGICEKMRTPDWLCSAGARKPQSEGSQAVDRASVK